MLLAILSNDHTSSAIKLLKKKKYLRSSSKTLRVFFSKGLFF